MLCTTICVCIHTGTSYGCFQNGAHHHLGLGQISPAEQDEVVKNVVEVVDGLAQLEALG